MPKVRITTARLPQPDRHIGAEIEVSDEKAASMVAQGFAEIIEVPRKKRGRPRKDADE